MEEEVPNPFGVEWRVEGLKQREQPGSYAYHTTVVLSEQAAQHQYSQRFRMNQQTPGLYIHLRIIKRTYMDEDVQPEPQESANDPS